MKKILCSVCLLMFLASVGFAMDVSLDTDLVPVSDLLGTTPEWLKMDTSYACPIDAGPNACTRDWECDGMQCNNPSGLACQGTCC